MSCNLFAQVKIITRVDSLFFIGINNEVIIQSEKIPVEKLSVNVIGGTVLGNKGKYVVHCSAQNTDVSVKVFYKKKLVAGKKMQSIRISDPVVYVAGDTFTRGGKISRKHILSFHSLVVKTNVPFLTMNVIKFDFKRMVNNAVIDSLKNSSYLFSPEIKQVFLKSMIGNVLIFENIFSTCPDNSGIIHGPIKLIVTEN